MYNVQCTTYSVIKYTAEQRTVDYSAMSSGYSEVNTHISPQSQVGPTVIHKHFHFGLKTLQNYKSCLKTGQNHQIALISFKFHQKKSTFWRWPFFSDLWHGIGLKWFAAQFSAVKYLKCTTIPSVASSAYYTLIDFVFSSIMNFHWSSPFVWFSL